jgi:hypothetical protein
VRRRATAPTSSSQNASPKKDDVGSPKREAGKQQLAAAEVGAVRLDQTGDEKRQRRKVPQHEQAEEEQSRISRRN